MARRKAKPGRPTPAPRKEAIAAQQSRVNARPRRGVLVALATGTVALAAGIAAVVAVPGLAGRAMAWALPPMPLTYRDTRIEVVMDPTMICGPSATGAMGEMSVPLLTFEGTAAGQTFEVTHYKHESCAAAGCPTRVFIRYPGGPLRLVANLIMTPLEPGEKPGAPSALQLSRDGRTLINGTRTYLLDW